MKRSRILIGATVLLVTVAAWWLVRQRAAPPLVYQDQPIEHWFAQSPPAVIPPPGVQFSPSARGFIKSGGQQ